MELYEKLKADVKKTISSAGTAVRTGLDWPGQDSTGQDRAGLDRAGLDWTGQDRAGLDWTVWLLLG